MHNSLPSTKYKSHRSFYFLPTILPFSLQWLRANVGVCPQHDVLYDELTAREHVLLFGAMRGLMLMSSNDKSKDKTDCQTEKIMQQTLGGVDMLGKADELVN